MPLVVMPYLNKSLDYLLKVRRCCLRRMEDCSDDVLVQEFYNSYIDKIEDHIQVLHKIKVH